MMSQTKPLSAQSYIEYHGNQMRLITAQSLLNMHQKVRASIASKETIVVVEMCGDAPEYLHAISRRGDGNVEVYDLGFLSAADASLTTTLAAITGAVKTRVVPDNYTLVMSISVANAIIGGVADPQENVGAMDALWDMLYQAKNVYMV